MNKAFVREPDAQDPTCPLPAGCGGPGTPVARRTILAQVPEDLARAFGESSFYCANPHCDVAYFDNWGTVVPRSAVRRLTYPKSSAAPVCPCFDISPQEVREASAAGDKARVRDMLARAESPEARCATESPTGRSCAAEFRRLFMACYRPDTGAGGTPSR